MSWDFAQEKNSLDQTHSNNFR